MAFFVHFPRFAGRINPCPHVQRNVQMSPLFRRRRKTPLRRNSWVRLRAQPLLVALEPRNIPAILIVTDPGDDGSANQLRAVWDTARTNNDADTILFAPN